MLNTPKITWPNLGVEIIPYKELISYIKNTTASNVDNISKYIQEYYENIIWEKYKTENIRITKKVQVWNDTRYFFIISNRWKEFNGAIMESSILPSYDRSIRFQKSWKSQ